MYIKMASQGTNGNGSGQYRWYNHVITLNAPNDRDLLVTSGRSDQKKDGKWKILGRSKNGPYHYNASGLGWYGDVVILHSPKDALVVSGSRHIPANEYHLVYGDTLMKFTCQQQRRG